MKKKDLIDEVAKKSGMPASDVRAILDAANDVAHQALTAGADVSLFGLGKLSSVTRSTKMARDVRRGTPVVVPPRVAVVYRPSSSAKRAANSPR
jgi:nucleoid DNA-binding protein